MLHTPACSYLKYAQYDYLEDSVYLEIGQLAATA